MVFEDDIIPMLPNDIIVIAILRGLWNILLYQLLSIQRYSHLSMILRSEFGLGQLIVILDQTVFARSQLVRR